MVVWGGESSCPLGNPPSFGLDTGSQGVKKPRPLLRKLRTGALAGHFHTAPSLKPLDHLHGTRQNLCSFFLCCQPVLSCMHTYTKNSQLDLPLLFLAVVSSGREEERFKTWTGYSGRLGWRLQRICSGEASVGKVNEAGIHPEFRCFPQKVLPVDILYNISLAEWSSQEFKSQTRQSVV